MAPYNCCFIIVIINSKGSKHNSNTSMSGLLSIATDHSVGLVYIVVKR